ncbi:LAME_0E11804g1_1 [Lachancea meyersii CBS 8951]|uniref:LAME_0E11804g1_1 n=1 Tax=Lachancea meyersii CBS 8951 TaxID=1266667 RepID=A0A1G4JL43_9SACH|nr:LAME_0E11804g1_1 [Lachancea meyersii CBS 8951]
MAVFTTNGMFILDEIHTDKQSFHNVIGGGGMFAMLGASVICADPKISKKLKWIVDRGSDFPDFVTGQIDTWQTGAVYRDNKSRLTTRAWNLYGDNDLRQFKYLSEKKRIDVEDWIEEFGLQEVSEIPIFHLLCAHDRAISILDELQKLGSSENKVFVWEPIPDFCDEAHATQIHQVVNRQDRIIISPNAEEGARLFGLKEPVSLQECVELLQKFDHFIADHNMCVLRCGKLGSLALGTRSSQGRRQIVHLPAYHSLSPSKVIDPTGGGNTFLGGFSLGFLFSKGDLTIASICGNTAAAVAIEQLGVPQRQGSKWNGLTFEERLNNYIELHKLPYSKKSVLDTLTSSGW